MKSPIIIGHRGASMHAPENTLAAFELAIAHNADAIEFDVKLSSDKEVVVIHDITVDRTTNGQGAVSKLSLESIKRLDAGGWFNAKYQGERIPTLEDVFELVGARIPMNIELTNYATPWDELVERVVDIVNKHHLADQVYFSSFFSRNLVKVRKLLPACGIGYLKYDGMAGVIQSILQPMPSNTNSLNPGCAGVNPQMVEWEHHKGRRVLVYTVNDPQKIKELLSIGVDGIFTDDPLMGKKVASSFPKVKTGVG